MVFLLSCLAVWRLCHMISAESGPWNIISRIRVRVGEGMVGRLMDCSDCLSIWLALPVALFLSRTVDQAVILWLAMSGVVVLMEAFHGMLRRAGT
jgi:hypothetical protein